MNFERLKLFRFPSAKLVTVTLTIICVNIFLLIFLDNVLNSQNLRQTVAEPYGFLPKQSDLDLTDKNFTKLFDLDFRFVINNDCKNDFQPRVIWIITSYFSHVELRSASRRSYPASLLRELGIRRVFLLARSKKNEISQNAVLHENSRYNDLVQGDFMEDYRNLTYKHVMGLKWAVHSCGQFQYIMKMDDDIVINLYELLSFLKSYKEEVNLLGYVMTHMEVIRRDANKWFVKNAEFPESEYPPFLSGWLYILSRSAAFKLLSFTRSVPYFWIDDVYVTGLLARKAGVSHQMMNSKFTTDYHYVRCCFKYEFACDILVGPNGGDNNLQVEFAEHSEKCQAQQCPPRPSNFSVQNRCVLPFELKLLAAGKASVDVLI